MVEIVSTLSLSLSVAEGALLALGCSLSGAIVAMGVAVPVGILLQLLAKNWRDSVFISAACAAVAFFLSGFYLWHAAGNLYAMERLPSALAMSKYSIATT